MRDPVNGDQFEQVDRRTFGGAHVVHVRTSGRFENSIGAEVRHDSIPTLALFHTSRCTRLGTARDDDVRQTSGGVWMQSAVTWSSWLRTTVGVRADRYAFDVDRNGRRSASLVSPKLSIIAGPWRGTELFANAGDGFHSNDARVTADGADPLVRTRGGEVARGRNTAGCAPHSRRGCSKARRSSSSPAIPAPPSRSAPDDAKESIRALRFRQRAHPRIS